MRRLFTIIGVIVGAPLGMIIGGIPTVMIFVAVHRNISFPYVDDFSGLSLVLKSLFLISIFIYTFGGGILGGIIGHKFGNRT